MAIYNQGILGAFTGTVGTVVGANWRGKNVMRSRPRSTKRTPTLAQQQHRDKFAKMAKFLNPLRNILNKYYGNNIEYKSRFNMAMS